MKGNILLGQARGKLGDIVFSRANGQQVARARAQKVKNPQTEAQMIQRIILNTVAQAYSKMSAITDHSFEGIPAGQQSMSYFMRKNMDALRQKVAEVLANGDTFSEVEAFSPINSNLIVPNVYIISKGTLPEIVPQVIGSNQFAVGLETNTYQAVLDKYGLERGDQITLVSLIGSATSPLQFKYARIILDPTNADGTPAPLSSAFAGLDEINLPSPRNEGEFDGISFDTSFGVLFKYTGQPLQACAVIVSRKKQDGTWLRSNSSFVLGMSVTGFFPSLQEALDLFASGSIDTLSDLYLNNAGKTNRVAAAEDGGEGGGGAEPVGGDGD